MKQLTPANVLLYHIVYTLARGVFSIIYRFRIIGRENLVGGGGFVLAPNHWGSIAPFLIVLARGFGKKMLIMGNAKLFVRFSAFRWFWNIAGVFPVVHGTGNRVTLNQVQQEVQAGRGLMIFPEGDRSPKSGLGSIKSGAFVVAMETGVDMIPCAIWYKAGWARPFSRVTVAFGRPLSMEELGLTGEYSVKKLRHAKEIYVNALRNLYLENKADDE